MKALKAMDLCPAITRIFRWEECPLSLFLKYSRTVLTQELVLFNTWLLGALAGSVRGACDRGSRGRELRPLVGNADDSQIKS